MSGCKLSIDKKKPKTDNKQTNPLNKQQHNQPTPHYNKTKTNKKAFVMVLHSGIVLCKAMISVSSRSPGGEGLPLTVKVKVSFKCIPLSRRLTPLLQPQKNACERRYSRTNVWNLLLEFKITFFFQHLD